MILYFSATGNSRYLAESLAGMVGDPVKDIAAEIKGDCKYVLKEGERVGIVSPVYFYGPPTILSDFISRMSFDRDPGLYLVLNYGTFPGKAGERFRKEIMSRGFDLKNIFEIRMPENYILMFDTPDREETDRILDEADSSVRRVADILRSDGNEDIVTDDTLYRRMVSNIARPFYLYGRGTGRFYADTKCMKCGRCVDLCPIGVIAMEGRKPVWKEHRCIRCCACINGCPYGAIEFGFFTKGRRRYLNPRVRRDGK